MQKTVALVLVLFATVFLSGCQSILEHNVKSGLQVITDDVPSSVYLDGHYVNSTPMIEKNLKPGDYTLRIEPTDNSLQAYETRVTLRKGLLTVVTWKPADRPEMSGGVIYEMEPLKDKSKSEISFNTVPDAAIITLEGRDKEFSPTVFSDVPPGNRSFEITLPSYETQSHTIYVQPGYRMMVKVTLAKLQPVEKAEGASSSASLDQSSASISAAMATASAKTTATPKPSVHQTLLSTSSGSLNR